jgi:hypothetical protein
VTTFSLGCAAPARPPTPAARLPIFDLLAAPVDPNVRYYVMLFGSQSTPRVPSRSHTWAMAMKVTRLPGAAPIIESHTISWMPASLNVRWWKFNVEPGVNVSNEFSIAHARQTGQRIAAWGPYETWYGLFQRFVVQKEFLESGAVGYQCIDTIGEAGRNGDGCDCFHALGDLDPYSDRRRYPLRQFGEGAALNIVRQLQERPTLIRPNQTHDWLFHALGLDRHPIKRRRYEGESVAFSPEAVLEYVRGIKPIRRGSPISQRSPGAAGQARSISNRPHRQPFGMW